MSNQDPNPLPAPRVFKFLAKDRTLIRFKGDGAISDTRWLLLADAIPPNLQKRADNHLIASTLSIKNLRRIMRSTANRQRSRRAKHNPDYFGSPVALFVGENGHGEIFNPDYISFLEHHIPDFSLRIGTDNDSIVVPAAIFSGRRKVGALMPLNWRYNQKILSRDPQND